MKPNSYKGFTFRYVVLRQGNNPQSDKQRPAKSSLIKDWLIIRDGKILDRARTLGTAKARIDSSLYDRKNPA